MADNIRDGHETKEHRGESSLYQAKREEIPRGIQILISKQNTQDKGYGPRLSIEENATLKVWQEARTDKHYIDLVDKSLAAMAGGPPLNHRELADLISKSDYPHDEH